MKIILHFEYVLVIVSTTESEVLDIKDTRTLKRGKVIKENCSY